MATVSFMTLLLAACGSAGHDDVPLDALDDATPSEEALTSPETSFTGCPYGSIQSRVQPNTSTPWTQTLTVSAGQSFRVGGFYNGSGYLDATGYIGLQLTGPNYVSYPTNGSFVTVPAAGSYTLRAYCGTLNDYAYVTVSPTQTWCNTPYGLVGITTNAPSGSPNLVNPCALFDQNTSTFAIIKYDTAPNPNELRITLTFSGAVSLAGFHMNVGGYNNYPGGNTFRVNAACNNGYSINTYAYGYANKTATAPFFQAAQAQVMECQSTTFNIYHQRLNGDNVEHVAEIKPMFMSNSTVTGDDPDLLMDKLICWGKTFIGEAALRDAAQVQVGEVELYRLTCTKSGQYVSAYYARTIAYNGTKPGVHAYLTRDGGDIAQSHFYYTNQSDVFSNLWVDDNFATTLNACGRLYNQTNTLDSNAYGWGCFNYPLP